MPYIMDNSPANLLAGYQTSPLAQGINAIMPAFNQERDRQHSQSVDNRRLQQGDRGLAQSDRRLDQGDRGLAQGDIRLDLAAQAAALQMQEMQRQQAEQEQRKKLAFDEMQRLAKLGQSEGWMQPEEGVQLGFGAIGGKVDPEQMAESLKERRTQHHYFQAVMPSIEEAAGMVTDPGHRAVLNMAVADFQANPTMKGMQALLKLVAEVMPEPEAPQSEKEQLEEARLRATLAKLLGDEDRNQAEERRKQEEHEAEMEEFEVDSVTGKKMYVPRKFVGRGRKISEASPEEADYFMGLAYDELGDDATVEDLAKEAATLMSKATWAP